MKNQLIFDDRIYWPHLVLFQPQPAKIFKWGFNLFHLYLFRNKNLRLHHTVWLLKNFSRLFIQLYTLFPNIQSVCLLEEPDMFMRYLLSDLEWRTICVISGLGGGLGSFLQRKPTPRYNLQLGPLSEENCNVKFVPMVTN